MKILSKRPRWLLMLLGPVMGVCLLSAGSAGAVTVGVSGNVDRGGGIANYSTVRTVVAQQWSDISLKMVTGPGITAKVRACGNGGGDGIWVGFSNGQTKVLRKDAPAGWKFCLSAFRTNSTWYPGADTWTGNLRYNEWFA